MNYLFEFVFKSGCINSNIHRWCREKEIDSFNSVGGHVYADIYGNGEYRKMVPVHVIKDTFEVYAAEEFIPEKNSGLKRLYPRMEKALMIHYPERKLRVKLRGGYEFDTTFTMPSEAIREYMKTVEFVTPQGDIRKVADYRYI